MSVLWNVDKPCPTCKAEPGQPCRRPNGDRWVTPYGAPRWHAARVRLVGAAIREA